MLFGAVSTHSTSDSFTHFSSKSLHCGWMSTHPERAWAKTKGVGRDLLLACSLAQAVLTDEEAGQVSALGAEGCHGDCPSGLTAWQEDQHIDRS